MSSSSPPKLAAVVKNCSFRVGAQVVHYWHNCETCGRAVDFECESILRIAECKQCWERFKVYRKGGP